MPHDLPNKHPNMFEFQIFTKKTSEYLCTQEMAQIQIQIIFEGLFIQIFEYSYSSLIVITLEKGSLMLSST